MTDQGQTPITTSVATNSTATVTVTSNRPDESNDSITATITVNANDAAMDTRMDVKSEHQKRKGHLSTSSSSTSSSGSNNSAPVLDVDADSDSSSEDRPDQKSKSNLTKQPKKKKSKRNINSMKATTDHPPYLASSSGAANPRGWSQLNIDFIESITAFLPAPEICYLHRTCHAWLHIANHIRTPHLRFPSDPSVQLTFKAVMSNLVPSVLRRHVSELVISQTITPTKLESIALHLPKLQKLNCRTKCTENSSWIFPPQLKELSVTFDLKPLSVMSPAAVVNSINQCIQGVSYLVSLNKLHIAISPPTDDWPDSFIGPGGQWNAFSKLQINLLPLSRLVESLTHLNFVWDVPLKVVPIPLLRQGINLISLKIGGQVTRDELSELLAEPLSFQLDEFNFNFHIYSNEDVPLLKRLTHLTKFNLWDNRQLSDLSFLPHMVQLRELRIGLQHSEQLAESLHASCCEYLTSLILDGSVFCGANIHDQDLSRIFSPGHMPVLKILHLSHLSSIESLAFMVHLSATLEEFRMERCFAIHPHQLVHLRFFPRLHRLDLIKSFPLNFPLDAATLASLDPSSDHFQREWFPSLTTFNYEPQHLQGIDFEAFDNGEFDVDDDPAEQLDEAANLAAFMAAHGLNVGQGENGQIHQNEPINEWIISSHVHFEF